MFLRFLPARVVVYQWARFCEARSAALMRRYMACDFCPHDVSAPDAAARRAHAEHIRILEQANMWSRRAGKNFSKLGFDGVSE